MAAIGLVELKYLDETNAYRRELVKEYNKFFEGNNKINIINITLTFFITTLIINIL